MSLSTTQYGYIIDPLVPLTGPDGQTIRNGYVRVFVAGSSTPVITYKNYDGATNEETIQLDNSGRTAYPVIVSKGNTYKVCVYDAEHSQESPILTIDKVVPAGANVEATTIVTGLDNVESPEAGWVKSSVSGTDAEVSLDATNVTIEVDTMVKATAASADYMVPLVHKAGSDPDKKITLGNIFKFVLNFIHSLTDTATESDLVSGNYFALDGSAGTKKLNSTTLLTKTAQNALVGNVAPAFDPNKQGGYKKDELVAYNGRLFVFEADHTGAWTGSDVSYFPVEKILKYLKATDASGLRVYAKDFSLAFSDVEGSGSTRTCTVTMTGNPIITWPGGYTSVSGAQTFSGAPYSYGGLFVRINKNTKSFVEFACYALSSFSPAVVEDNNILSIPLAIWYSGVIVYSCNERALTRNSFLQANRLSSNCVTDFPVSIEFTNVSGSKPSKTATLTIKKTFIVSALRAYKQVSVNTTFENCPYSYGGLYFIVNKVTPSSNRVEVARLAYSSVYPTVTEDEVAFPIILWIDGVVVYSCRAMTRTDYDEIIFDDLNNDYTETKTPQISVGVALNEIFELKPEFSGSKCILTLSSDTAAIITIGVSYDSTGSSSTFLYKGISAGETWSVEIDVPGDKTNLIVWTASQNVTAAGTLTISFKRKSVLSLISSVLPEKINPQILCPNSMYVVCNDIQVSSGSPRNYSVKMFVDHLLGFVTKNISPKFLDGKITKDLYGKINSYQNYINSSVANQTKDVDTSVISDKIILSDVEKYDVSFNLISTRNKATQTKKCRLLCIGDSVTQGYLAGEGKPYTNCPEQYWAWVKMLFESDKAQNNNSGFYFESLGNLLGTTFGGVTFDIDFDGVQKTGVAAYACGVGASRTSDWVSATLNNDVANPFFDTATNKFSLRYWVENYRTMVVGSDGIATRCDSSNKGPLVTDVNAYNVCEPTHVLIQLGYNQSYRSAGTTRTNYINDLKTMIENTIAEYPSIKILLSLPDTACTFNLGKFREMLSSENDIYTYDATKGSTKTYHDSFLFMNKDLMDIAEEYSENVIYTPTFFASPSVLGGVARNVPDLSFLSNKNVLSDGKVMYSGNPCVHPNNAAHASIGYEIYSVLKNDLLTQQ